MENPNVHTSIDGHWWVVRNGTIIDPDFPEYDKSRYIFDCTDEKVYLPAPEPTQSLMVSMYKRRLMKIFKVDLWEEAVQCYFKLAVAEGEVTPDHNCCYQNALFEIGLNGGELVLGSFGWMRKSGEVHYEYGGGDYVTINDFVNGKKMAMNEDDMRRAIEYMMKESKMKKCAICKCNYIGNGHNARPIRTGRCCDNCNMAVVMARIPKKL